MSRYVFDSFAVLASYWSEPGAFRVRDLLLDRRNECWMSIINLGEMYYRIAREEDIDSADRTLVWIDRLPVRFVDVDWPMTHEAARIKATYALSYADCFAAALARQLDARVVTGDREFRPLEAAGVIDVEWLPRARARR